MTAHADSFELSEDYVLLQTIEGDLKYVRLLLVFDVRKVSLDLLLVVQFSIRRYLQLDEDSPLHFHLASHPEGMKYLLHQQTPPTLFL